MNIKWAVPGSKYVCHMNFSWQKKLTLEDSLIGMDSGSSKCKWHLCLFDYDEFNPEQEYQKIMEEQGHRQALLVESSPGKFQIADFTKRTWPDYLGILSKTSSDDKHKFCTMKMGFSTLRVTEKNGSKPKIIKVLKNPNGTRFYNYDVENIYRNLIEGQGLELKRVISKLSKEDKGMVIHG